MTGQRTFWVAITLFAGGLLVIPAGVAHADEGGDVVTAPRGTPYGSRCHTHCHPSGPVGYDHHDGYGCTPCGHHGYRGSSWGHIRYHLTGKELVRRMHLQHYFLRRYPFRRGVTRRFSSLTPERAAGINRHGVVRVDDVRRATDLERAGINRHGVVFVDAQQPPRGGDPRPDPIDYLNRGMARFHHGMYKQAAVDFDAALAGSDDLAPARYGRMLCAVIAGKWDAVADQLAHLARQGELRAEDRLLVNAVFRKASAYPSILDGLRGYVRFKGGASASLVAAWAHVAVGRTDEAKPFLRRFRRANPKHAALPILEKAAGVSAPKPAATPTPAKEEPVRPTAPALRPVSPFTPPLADSKAG